MLSPIANQNHWFPPYYPPTGLPYNLDYFHHTYPAMGGAHFSQDYPRGRGYSYRGRNGGPSRGWYNSMFIKIYNIIILIFQVSQKEGIEVDLIHSLEEEVGVQQVIHQIYNMSTCGISKNF